MFEKFEPDKTIDEHYLVCKSCRRRSNKDTKRIKQQMSRRHRRRIRQELILLKEEDL